MGVLPVLLLYNRVKIWLRAKSPNAARYPERGVALSQSSGCPRLHCRGRVRSIYLLRVRPVADFTHEDR